MVISSRYQFVFIHIPKCAGTYVRKELSSFGDRKIDPTDQVAHHSEIGLLDYAHIPLFTLRKYFDSEFKSINKFWSFAIVRDPYERFISSVYQRMRMYGGQPIEAKKPSDIKDEINRCIKSLTNMPRDKHLLPPKYIHFQKQTDYTHLDGQKLVDSIYLISELERLLDDLTNRVGHPVGSTLSGFSAANRSMVARNLFTRYLWLHLWPLVRRLQSRLPSSAEALRSVMCVPLGRHLDSLFYSEYVIDFIRDYYREDLSLVGRIVRERESSIS